MLKQCTASLLILFCISINSGANENIKTVNTDNKPFVIWRQKGSIVKTAQANVVCPFCGCDCYNTGQMRMENNGAFWLWQCMCNPSHKVWVPDD
jgi:hypothetical protein